MRGGQANHKANLASLIFLVILLCEKYPRLTHEMLNVKSVSQIMRLEAEQFTWGKGIKLKSATLNSNNIFYLKS